MIVALYFLLKPKQEKKVPTLEDIRRKYPVRKSQEKLRAEALRDRQDDHAKKITQMRERKNKTYTKSTSDSSKYKKLLAMLNGDRAAAERLVAAYGIDKAIADLERDRQ